MWKAMTASIFLALAALAGAAPVSAQSFGLVEAGYTAIPLRVSPVGHLHTDGVLQGRLVEVLIDTGASNTVIDADLAVQLGLVTIETGEGGAGVGDSRVSARRVQGANITVGGVRIDGEIYTMDLGHLRKALEERGLKAPDLVLGGDAMRRLDAILVYRELSLYLRPEPQ